MKRKVQLLIIIITLVSSHLLLAGCASTPHATRPHPYQIQKPHYQSEAVREVKYQEYSDSEKVQVFAANAVENAAYGALYGVGIVAGVFLALCAL